jgi:hypothetical protein
MADNTQVPGGTGDTIRDKDRAGVKTQIVGLDLNIAGAETLMAGSLPVTGPLTDTQLRATAVPVSGTFFQATQPVSGTVTVANPTANPETGLAKDATLTGGTAKAIARGGAKGTTAAADLTSNPVDANTQALHATLVGTQATVPVTGPLTDTQLRASAVPVSMATNTPDVTDRAARLLGVVTANGQATATSAVTNVAASATSVTLKAPNASRKGLYIFNAGTANLFVKLGATATTTTSFTVMIAPNGFWELPDTPIYTGVVDAIWSATGGNGALVTELT